MKYELSKIEREIRPEIILNALNDRQKHESSIVNLGEIDEVFNVPLTQLILYQNTLIKYNDLFISEEYRITQSLKDFEINNNGDSNNYIIVNYKGLIKLYNKKDAIMPPKKYIDTNLRLVDDVKKAIIKQIKHDLQIRFVIPIKTIFENDFKEILIDFGHINSAEKLFLLAIKGNNISIEVLPMSEPLNSQYVYCKNSNSNFQLNYNYHGSPYEYQKNMEQLFEAFKESIQNKYSVSSQQIIDLEKLSEIKSAISEILNHFQPISNLQQPVYLKTDTLVNLKQALFSLSLQNEISEFQSILQCFLSIQYQFLINAVAFVENKIELIKYTIDLKNNDTSLSTQNKINTKLTVPQLAYLFRCFYDEKGILNEKSKAGLFRKIAANFKTERQDKISPTSISNKFSSPDANTIEFLAEKLTHLMQLAKKDAEFFGV